MNENPYAPPTSRPLAREEDLPPAPHDIRSILFSFRGRIPRSTLWLYYIGLKVADKLTDKLIERFLPPRESYYLPLFIALQIPFLWMTFALYSKRWHDRNMSAWWNLSYLPMMALIGWYAYTITHGGKPGTLFIISAVIVGLSILWLTIEIAFRRGTVGPNKYGEDPLGA